MALLVNSDAREDRHTRRPRFSLTSATSNVVVGIHRCCNRVAEPRTDIAWLSSHLSVGSQSSSRSVTLCTAYSLRPFVAHATQLAPQKHWPESAAWYLPRVPLCQPMTLDTALAFCKCYQKHFYQVNNTLPQPIQPLLSGHPQT